MTGLPQGLPLFRREVVERRSNVLYGTTLLPPPRLYSLLSWGAVAMVAGIVAALMGARYTPHIAASGWLVHDPGDAVISSPRAGTVTRIFESDGATVEAGAALIEIQSDRPSSLPISIELQILESLRTEASSLAQQIRTEEALLKSEQRTVQSELLAIDGNLARLADMLALAGRKRAMADAAKDRTADLVGRGLLPRTALESAESETLAARIAVREIEQRQSQETAARLARQARAETLPLLARQQIADLERLASAVAVRLTEAESQRAGVLRAPITARVTRILVSQGQSVTAGTELLTLVPKGARLQAELMIPTRAAGFVSAGMPVRIRYDAFPFQQFGQHPGTVQSVDGAVIGTGQRPGDPAYRVSIAISGQSIRAADGPVPLRAGMTLQADILQQQRRIMDWLVDPLQALRPG